MRRFILPFLVVLVAIALSLGMSGSPAATGGPLPAIFPGALPSEDPFPIFRVRASEEEASKILKQSESGPLVSLSRGDFETRVSLASRQVAESKVVPRLTQTRYTASLVGGDLTGTAELDLVNPGTNPRFFPLDPLRLALTSASWGDGKEAVIGIPQGSSAISVWVDRPGPQTLKFGWSAAGSNEFGERRFELRLPTALSNILDLDLPAGQRPSIAADVLLTGPFPVAGDSNRASWRFRFGGRSRALDFTIRTGGAQGAAASSILAARYDLSPGLLNGTFEYDLRPAKGTVGEWQFLVDPGLRVTDAVVNNRSGWQLDPPQAPGGPRRLRVNLNQPGIGGKVVISCQAPFPDLSRPAASLPMVRPLSAVIDDETLEIHVAPELKPNRWLPGDYKIVDSRILADHTELLTLSGTLVPAGADRLFRQPPTLATVPSEPEYWTREQIAWRFDASRAFAQVQLNVRVRRGPLFRLALRPPPGYTFIRANSPQEDLIACTEFANGVAVVEFNRALSNDQTAELNFEFRGPPAGATRFVFPAFVPVGATQREGVLGVSGGSFWEIDARPGVGMTAVSWLDLNAIHPPAEAAVSFRYRGGNPEGSATLAPIRPIFTVDTTNRIDADAAKTITRTSFTIRLRSGSLSTVSVLDPDPAAVERNWKVVSSNNSVVSTSSVSIAELMKQTGLLVPAPAFRLSLPARNLLSQGRIWAIRFAHPVNGEVVLETAVRRPADKEMAASPPTILGAAETHLMADSVPLRPNHQTPERTWTFADLYLVTAVRSESEAEVAFGGTVTHAAARHLPIRLPPGAQVRAASVGGSWLERGVQQLNDSGILTIPLNSESDKPVQFEVWYQLPVESGFPARVKSPEPVLPGAAEIHRWWTFGSQLLPGWPVRAWERGKTSELPTLFGGPAIVGSGALVSNSQVEEVRVGSTRLAVVVGLLAATALFLLSWLGVQRRHRIFGLVVVFGLFAVGTAALLGPPWWQRAALIPLAVGLLAAAGMVVIRGHRPAIGAAAGILFICTLSGFSTAQPPPPAVVVLLPADAENRENVVASKALLDRLDSIARPTPPGVLISASEYTITVEDASARVTAQFTAHALAETNLSALLPLNDARLESMSIDGAPAFPQAQKPGQYSVALPSRGRHEIQVQFVVPLAASGTERELRFGVPECPTTRITALFPQTARQIQLAGRLGKQTSPEGNTKRLEVDAGNIKSVQFRWRDGTGTGTAGIRVREASIWDVGEKGAELTSCYHIRAEGTISTLRFDVPAELEPIDVLLRPDFTGPNSLRDWSIGPEQGGFRQLRLDLQGPTSGRMLVILSCRLKKAFTSQARLRFPRPVIQGGGNADGDIAIGLRARDKVSIEDPGRTGLIDFDPGVLTRDKEWLQVPALRLETNSPIRVFRPAPNASPELHPLLRIGTEQPTVNLDTAWHLEPHHAEANGTIAWKGKDAISLLEFVLPGIKLLEIHGREVGTWSQSGGRSTIWFRKPVAEGELEWLGSALPLPGNQPPPNPFPFESVVPRVMEARLGTSTVRIRPLEGWSIRSDRDRGWTALPRPDDVLAFQSTSAAAMPVRVLLSPALATPRKSAIEVVTSPPRLADSQAKSEIKAADAPSLAQPPEAAQKEHTWVLPASAMIGWSAAIAILALLQARFPRASWPEQFGLLIGLFGMTIAGQWWLGVVAWLLARAGWFVELLIPKPPGQQT